jgi:phospho-N-acetylmuramoyl-pentapeptide-transferase
MIEYVFIFAFSTSIIKFLISNKGRAIFIPSGPRTLLIIGNHQEKGSIQSFGGISFLCVCITMLFKYFLIIECMVVVCISILSALIGFIDDIEKSNGSGGITPLKKLIPHSISVFIIIFIWYMTDKNIDTSIKLASLSMDIGPLYVIWATLVVISTVHAVNITDGIDGLASTQSILTLSGLVALNAILPTKASLVVFNGAFYTIAALFIFLNFNKYPAKIFMGDVGSLFLGGYISSLFLISKKELLLPICGIVFVVETATSIIQKISLKTTGKKVFPFTPIHHTFEKLGFSENEIVFNAIGISIISQIASIFILYLATN